MRGTLAIIVFVVGVVLTGCGLLPPRQIGTVIPQRAGRPAVPVDVVDPAGLVASIAVIAPGGPVDRDNGIVLAAGRSDEAIVQWLGGVCDERTTITFGLREPTIDVTLLTTRIATAFACPDVGEARAVTIAFAVPLGNRGFAWHLDPGP